MDTATLHHNRGVARADLGNHVEAIAEYNIAIEQNAELAGVWLSMGNSRAALEDFAAAVDAFSKALELNESLAEAYRGRSLANQQLGNDGAAAADLLEYARRTGGNP